MSYAIVNDRFETMNEEHGSTEHLALFMAGTLFLIRAAWAFGTRCIYWLGRQPLNIYLQM
jgi:hypothetical protein